MTHFSLQLKMRKKLNNALSSFALATCSLLLLSSCSDAKDTNASASAMPELVISQIQLEGVTISGADSRIIDAIEYVNGFLYVADHNADLYRLNLTLAPQPKASLDTTFGEGGKISFEGEIRSMTSVDDNLVLETKKGTYLLQDGQATKVNLGAEKVKFLDDGSFGVGLYRRDLVFLERKDGEFTTSPSLEEKQLILPNIQQLGLTQNTLLIGGYGPHPTSRGNKFELIGFSHDGEVKFRIGEDDPRAQGGFCYVKDIEAFNDIILLLDHNCRSLNVISKGGDFLNKIKLSDKLEVGYTWYPDSTVGPEDTWIVVGVNDDEEDDVHKAKFYIFPESELKAPQPE